MQRLPHRLPHTLPAVLWPLLCLALAAATLALLVQALSGTGAAGPGHTLQPQQAQFLADARAAPPPADAGWQPVAVPHGSGAPVGWYRVDFTGPADPSAELWALYLPYLYGGGRIWLNGQPVAALVENSASLRVRWERPQLLPLPPMALRPGPNVLLLRPVAAHQPSGVRLPPLALGPQRLLQGPFDRRLFVVRTLPVTTVLAGAVAGSLVLFIWLRRRQELAYGLFGLAALLWALRTTTFVFDALPPPLWDAWRLLYHGATGGFIVVLALFVLHLAGWLRPRLAAALAAYALLGPLLYLASGSHADVVVGRWWVLGLAPIGLGVAVVSLATAWRRPRAGNLAIAAAVVLAALAGVHDYAVAWSAPWLELLLPRWAGQRFFLLHHAANLLLLVMGVLLALRFARSLGAEEQARRTLELRVAEREREIAANYARIAALQREQAAQDERQRIVQDLHDGLGAQLLTALLRAERGALDAPAMAHSLRAAIDAMRIAIDALAGEGSDAGDLRSAFGSLRERWQPRLQDAGITSDWCITWPDAGPGAAPDSLPPVAPHALLQLLHVAQEALANAVKHAQARQVMVSLRQDDGMLLLQVQDDGRGGATDRPGGRGLANLRRRAARLGAALQIDSSAAGTTVLLRWPLTAPATAPR